MLTAAISAFSGDKPRGCSSSCCRGVAAAAAAAAADAAAAAAPAAFAATVVSAACYFGLFASVLVVLLFAARDRERVRATLCGSDGDRAGEDRAVARFQRKGGISFQFLVGLSLIWWDFDKEAEGIPPVVLPLTMAETVAIAIVAVRHLVQRMAATFLVSVRPFSCALGTPDFLLSVESILSPI